MLLDPSTIAAFMHVCPRSMLSPALPFSLLFLLPGYNGQTHNKEGKTRDCGTRYVGRLTMEHTWARAGAFEVALGRQKVPHGAPVWNVGGEGGKRKKRGGTRRKAQGTEQCFQPLLPFLLLLLFNCGWCCTRPFFNPARVPAWRSPICSRNAEHGRSLGTHVVVKQHGIIQLALSRVRKLSYSRVILLANRS